MKEIMACLEQIQQEIGEAKLELGEQQEIIQWDQHEAALQMIDRGDHEKSGEIVKSLDSLKKLLAECKREIHEYEERSRQYDELAAQLEKLHTEKQRLSRTLRLHRKMLSAVWISGSQISMQQRKILSVES